MRFRVSALRSMTFVVAIPLAISACSEPSFPPVSPGKPHPTFAAPTVTHVLPSVGSGAGGATIQVVGTGFVSGMVVTFDGMTVRRVAYPVSSSMTFHGEAPAHSVGTVDVVVTNPDGQSHRLEAGYTYAPPEAFDLNGAWWGYTDNGTDTGVEFEIKGNRLVSATCAYEVYVPFVFSEPPNVENGEFQLTAEGGATLTGRAVSPSEIVGTIHFPLCNPSPLTWRVHRKIG